ncbi:MAG: ABC transporter permease subunit [Clostridiales bacterium]|nr:ABC transporter permease subunit [Clostridiales bacterium]
MGKPGLKKLLIALGWLALWQLASLWVNQSVILAGPAEAFQALLALVVTAEFWQTVLFTFLRILGGFLLAFAAGLAAGGLAHRFPLVGDILAPAVTAMKSVPVACFVILALVWVGSQNLTFLIVFLVAFPILYLQTREGLERADRQLLEMAWVFRLSPWRRFRYVYLPALLPSLMSGCQLALGMSWKSGVAAEVIGTPLHSIGQQLYFAKIYLEIDDLFAWTFVILALSALFERAFLWLLGRIARRWEGTDDLRL